jgi:hypothetical protein
MAETINTTMLADQNEAHMAIAIKPTGASRVCGNCTATRTPLWRRGPQGEHLCNGNFIFYKNIEPYCHQIRD